MRSNVEHAVLNASSKHARTYCGRVPSEGFALLKLGEQPSCGSCRSSELWRRDLQYTTIRFVVKIHDADVGAAYRACIAMIEEAMGPERMTAQLAQRLSALARWGYTRDPYLLPQSFRPGDTGGGYYFGEDPTYSEGMASWVYNLTEAAWSIRSRGKMSSRQIERLTSDTSEWCTGVGDGFDRLKRLEDNVRARLLPWLLRDEDPLPAFAEFLDSTPWPAVAFPPPDPATPPPMEW